jgi:hypothetical protein
MVSYCYHGDGSGESIPDGDLPIANARWGLGAGAVRAAGSGPGHRSRERRATARGEGSGRPRREVRRAGGRARRSLAP